MSAYPVFPGKEAHYLRALVGHIAAETTLVPMGSFTGAAAPRGAAQPSPWMGGGASAAAHAAPLRRGRGRRH